MILLGNNSCGRLKPCAVLCLPTPSRTAGYKCACSDNMQTVQSASGRITCRCKAGEVMVNGECVTRSKYSFALIVFL